MKRLIFAFALVAPLAFGQGATINSPIARSSETQYKIDSLLFTRFPVQAIIHVSVQDAGSVETRRLSFTVPGDGCASTTFAGLMTAMANPAANETGTDTRKMSFRIITYLNAQSCLGAITLVP